MKTTGYEFQEFHTSISKDLNIFEYQIKKTILNEK